MEETEAGFQRHLDAFPDDHIARLAFADFLEEQDPPDPRAAGYRALGVNQWRACLCKMKPGGDISYIFGTKKNAIDRDPRWPYYPCLIAHEWYRALFRETDCNVWWRYWNTRREAEDDIALAFARLPAHRRAALLATHTEARA